MLDVAAASVVIILIRWITLPDDDDGGGGLGDLGPGIGGFDAGRASA